MNNSSSFVPKNWKVELRRFDRFWFDMIINPRETEQGSSAKLISSIMEGRKNEVEDILQNKFVYYICSRKKIRFNINKVPKFYKNSQSFKFSFIVGEKDKDNFQIRFLDEKGEYCKPDFLIDEKFITIIYPSNYKTTYPIHEFLESFKANTGISSKVEYVGYTINPDTRPLKGHDGLISVLHNIDTKNCDIMIYYNTFKIVDANNYREIDGLSIEDKYKLTEKCLIEYFDSDNQNKNRTNETGFARNMFHKNNISTIEFYLEHSDITDYTSFCSSKVLPSSVHRFKAIFNNGRINIV